MRATATRITFVTIALAALVLIPRSDRVPEEKRPEGAGPIPSDWFFRQRAYPYDDINQEARLEAYRQARSMPAPALRNAASWDPVGPTNIGGRIADLAAHPSDEDVCYAGAAEGGVFKTTDGGSTWTPTFDQQSSLSIGSVAIDPNDPDVIWVGTGEPNGGGGSVTYGGTGVFKSTNAGASWQNVGLPESRHIGRLVVDPSNSDRVFVAVVGALWSTNPERGVYRTTNAGGSWDPVLASTDSTGAIDVAVHPTDSNVVYAALWERTRGPAFINYGGPTSGLHRSTDGGDTWHELTNGLPPGSVGRIGIAIAESSPNTVYAIYAEANPGFFLGVFKTTNGGDSWTQTNDGALANVYSSFGWWFGNIRVDPSDPDRVFVLGLDFFRSTNGGSSWSDTGSSMHVDHHGLDFGPDPSVIYEGNDGGMYRSTNGGSQWTKLPDLPVTQFYTTEVDFQFPERRYGGTQDNGTNRTLTGGDSDWHGILGGDGFYCQVDPLDNDFVYAEWQNGNLRRSTNGGNSFSDATSGLVGPRNWSMPVTLDPSDPSTLYCGTDRVHRSTNRAVSWDPISPGLTGRTLTTVAVATTDPGVIWAGSEDGNVWVTTNGGTSWSQVDSALPDRWITRVAIDPTDASISYVTVSGFRWDEPFPHVFRSTDFGATFTDVSSNLPQAPVNDIVIDPANPSVLYVGTDFGTYFSSNGGVTWTTLGADLPNVVVNDLELHEPSRTLFAGTYGRSMWTLDVTLATGIGSIAGPVATATAPRLQSVSPNPAPKGRASIHFQLPRAAEVALDVFDVTGRRVAVLARGPFEAGEDAVSWDGRSEVGTPVPSGVYFVRLVAEGVVRTRKLTVTR